MRRPARWPPASPRSRNSGSELSSTRGALRGAPLRAPEEGGAGDAEEADEGADEVGGAERADEAVGRFAGGLDGGHDLDPGDDADLGHELLGGAGDAEGLL